MPASGAAKSERPSRAADVRRTRLRASCHGRTSSWLRSPVSGLPKSPSVISIRTGNSPVPSSMRTIWRSLFTPFVKSASSSQLWCVPQPKKVANPMNSSWANAAGVPFRPQAWTPSPQLSATPRMMTCFAMHSWKTFTAAS